MAGGINCGGIKMDTMKALLSQKPEVGITAAIMGAVMPLIDTLTPILQFIALATGVAIGLVTLAIKIKEWRHKNE